jgi:hypothetical protein
MLTHADVCCMQMADRVVTVSPSYREEICTDQVREMTYADVCWRMLTYVRTAKRSAPTRSERDRETDNKRNTCVCTHTHTHTQTHVYTHTHTHTHTHMYIHTHQYIYSSIHRICIYIRTNTHLMWTHMHTRMLLAGGLGSEYMLPYADVC